MKDLEDFVEVGWTDGGAVAGKHLQQPNYKDNPASAANCKISKIVNETIKAN